MVQTFDMRTRRNLGNHAAKIGVQRGLPFDHRSQHLRRIAAPMPHNSRRRVVATRLDAQKGKCVCHGPPLIAACFAGNISAMARQSHPTVLLTRPLAASQRFAQALDGNFVISPLMEPEFLTPQIPATNFAALVFTSETGVAAAIRLGIQPNAPAYCVGKRTAQTARRAGWDAISADGDASDLLALIIAQNPGGPLLLIRPEDAAADLQGSLLLAGIETIAAIVYRQKPAALTLQATELLQQPHPILLPLFSPRSARLFGNEYRRISGIAPLLVAAISPAVIAELDFPVQDSQVAERPDAAAMRQAMTEVTQRSLGA